MLNTRRIKIQPKKNSITFRDKYLNNGTGLNFQQKRKKESIFSKFNNFLNKLSFSQYLILVVLICGISIFAFDQVPFLFNSKNGNETHAEDLNNDSCNNIFDPSCWTGSFFPELKQKDHLTNALLVGLDTRNSNSGLMNTDTILLASYDHETGKTLLISFPRDLYVPYIYNGKGPFMTKINSIYAIGENSGEDGLKLLKSNIEEWFDIEIHYSAKVYFNTVVDLVDKMGGIDIDVEKDYVDIYPYDELSETRKQDCQIPENYPSYCLFKFEEGINHLSGEEALIYARMRQYTSDFDRARRQQQVIDAIKTKGKLG